MWEYIRDAIMWIVTAIVVIFVVNKTGDIYSLLIFTAPVAVTLFKELLKLN